MSARSMIHATARLLWRVCPSERREDRGPAHRLPAEWEERLPLAGLSWIQVEVGGIEPPSPGDRSGLLRAQPVGRSRLEAPTGGGPLGQPGFDVRLRPPGGAVTVSLLTTPILPSQATGRGRLPSYLGSERVIVIGACVGPGF